MEIVIFGAVAATCIVIVIYKIKNRKKGCCLCSDCPMKNDCKDKK